MHSFSSVARTLQFRLAAAAIIMFHVLVSAQGTLRGTLQNTSGDAGRGSYPGKRAVCCLLRYLNFSI